MCPPPVGPKRTINADVSSGNSTIAYIKSCQLRYKQNDGEWVTIDAVNPGTTRTFRTVITDATTESFTLSVLNGIGAGDETFGAVGIGVSAGSQEEVVAIVFRNVVG